MGQVYGLLFGRDKDAEIIYLRRLILSPSLHQALQLCSRHDIPPLLENFQRKYQDLETSQKENNRRQSNIDYLESKLQTTSEQLTQLEVERARSDEAKEASGAFISIGATPDLLQHHVREVMQALAKFCGDLLFKALEVMPKEALEATLKNVAPGLSLNRSSHVKYILQANISFQLFRDFENDTYVSGGATLCIDKSERSRESFQQFQSWTDPRSYGASTDRDQESARAFMEEKMDMLVSSILRYFGPDLPSKSWIEQEGQHLLRAAWVLHHLAFAFEPPARILRAPPRGAYNSEWMDFEGCFDGEKREDTTSVRVGVMTMPGFQVKSTYISCQIYPSFDG